jgi:hypothetical protein
MITGKPYLHAIEASLSALRAILANAMHDIDHGLEAAGDGNQNGAVGSIIPTNDLLKQATTLLDAVLILHRQT